MSPEQKSLLSYEDILFHLEEICRARKSGTLFISSNDNRAASFVVKEGEVVSCTFGHERGLDALEQIREMKGGSCAFSERLFFSLAEDNPLPPTPEVFKILGLPTARFEEMGEAEPTAPEPEKISRQFYYRGALIQDSAPAALPEKEKEIVSPPAEPGRKKAKRIYRGRVIED